MDSAQPNQSILETLRTVEFRLGLKGYNVDEVDEYLEKAAVEAESVLEQFRGASERLQRANERIAQLELDLERAPADRSPVPDAAPCDTSVSDETLQRTLLLAQKFVDQTKRESEAEAAEMVSRAEERARMVVTQAEERARQMTTEAEQRLRDEVGRLESARTRLAADVEAMARHLEEQRAKIRSSLTDALKWVDERLQPAGALTAVRARDKGDDSAPALRPPEAGRGAPALERTVAPERRVPAGAVEAAGAGAERSSVTTRLRTVDASTQLDELFERGPRSD